MKIVSDDLTAQGDQHVGSPYVEAQSAVVFVCIRLTMEWFLSPHSLQPYAATPTQCKEPVETYNRSDYRAHGS